MNVIYNFNVKTFVIFIKLIMIKLNLGDSRKVPKGWIFIDYSLASRIASIPILGWIVKHLKIFNNERPSNLFIHDLTKPLPWPDNSVDIIYSSHCIEHLNKDDGFNLLKECKRVLKPGGIIRIVVPDFRYIVDNYLEGKINSADFIEALDVLNYDGSSFIKKFYSFYFSYPHKAMYDHDTLSDIFRSIDLTPTIKRYNDSKIPDIHKVEIRHRCNNAVILEAIKSPI
tara:strand:- start:419 stop:1099 length:681 start_codon:yes stop_codon:yes gene_type:complete